MGVQAYRNETFKYFSLGGTHVNILNRAFSLTINSVKTLL